MPGTTTHYGWAVPTNYADDDTWGTELNATLSAIDAQLFTIASVSPSFTAVQQGGGTGQLGNKLYLGWSGSTLKAQVDTTDMGSVPTGLYPAGFFRTGTGSGGLVTISSGGPSGTPANGDLWLMYVP